MLTKSGAHETFNRVGHAHELDLAAGCTTAHCNDGPWHYQPTGYDGGYGYRHGLRYEPYSPGYADEDEALLQAEIWEGQHETI